MACEYDRQVTGPLRAEIRQISLERDRAPTCAHAVRSSRGWVPESQFPACVFTGPIIPGMCFHGPNCRNPGAQILTSLAAAQRRRNAEAASLSCLWPCGEMGPSLTVFSHGPTSKYDFLNFNKLTKRAD